MNEKLEQAVFAGGCFWCTEAVFQQIDGVEKVVSGYTGGSVKNPAYREVCSGRTGHAEAIKIDFDPVKVSYNTLLELFFATHDPTTLNRQGNDRGTQYRSAIFYATEDQKDKAEAFVELLSNNSVFENDIVTEINSLGEFYVAELNHQNYFNDNTNQPYCQFVVAPKVEKVKKYYSDKLKSS